MAGQYGDMGKLLETQPRESEYLFARGSRPIRDFRESWDLACERAGVPELLFHDLRRTAVRNLRRASVAETVIMRITGHRTRGVFKRYNIADQSDTQEAGRMAQEFLAKEHEKDFFTKFVTRTGETKLMLFYNSFVINGAERGTCSAAPH
jgi:integrase